MKNNSLELSINDTTVLKGVAILLLLAHHLFYQGIGYNDVHLYGNHYLVKEIGIISKLCVAIFVFLSGYGLTVNAEKSLTSLKTFYVHRFVKLMANYWFIWIIFVPIGVFVFNRTFQDVYGDHVFFKFMLDFLGLISTFGTLGYNATWWFYSLIIILYLLFPFIYKLAKEKPILLLTLSLILYFIPVYAIIGFRWHTIAFVMGVISCLYIKKKPYFGRLGGGGIFIVLLIERIFSKEPILHDSILVLVMVIVYKNIQLKKPLYNALIFIGKHSMNIFLFHTFIFSHWFRDEIYESHNPLIIFLLLLSTCIIISIILEYIKRAIHFETLLKKLNSLL